PSTSVPVSTLIRPPAPRLLLAMTPAMVNVLPVGTSIVPKPLVWLAPGPSSRPRLALSVKLPAPCSVAPLSVMLYGVTLGGTVPSGAAAPAAPSDAIRTRPPRIVVGPVKVLAVVPRSSVPGPTFVRPIDIVPLSTIGEEIASEPNGLY